MKLSRKALNSFLKIAHQVTLKCESSGKIQNKGCIVDTNGSLYQSQKEIQANENQQAYNFLHRSPHRHSDLGGYGEDFGFHYPPRVFVDPDSPHIYPFFNRWHQSANLREARYSHHRRMLKSLDVSKLIRHGRMLPLPHKLLNDYLMSKIPLRDSDCSAFFDYAHLILIKTTTNAISSDQDSYFNHIVDMFERLLATKLPPSDVGPKTHAAIIRCCSQLKKFTEGYQWFRERAISTRIEHTLELFDSIIELCEKCNENAIAWKEFEKMLRNQGYAPPITLCRMLRIAGNEANYERGRDVWELFDFYKHKKNGNIYEAGLEWLSECNGKGREALYMITEMRHQADKNHAKRIYSSTNSPEGTYDRFSSKIIHNNQSVNSSGIPLFNSENRSYSNNHSIAEYEASAFMKSLYPTPGMILSVLYCLIKTDEESYKLAWNVFFDHFVSDGLLDFSICGNMPFKFVNRETITYMFFGASLYSDLQNALKLYNILHTSKKFIGTRIMPEAIYYWFRTIRTSLEKNHGKFFAKKTIFSTKESLYQCKELNPQISSSRRLNNLLLKTGNKIDPNFFYAKKASLLETLESVLTKTYITLVYEVPIIPDCESHSMKRQFVVMDISECKNSPFRNALAVVNKDLDELSSESSIVGINSILDSDLLNLPQQLENDIRRLEERSPSSTHEEWIYTEYIGALASFPWALEINKSESRLSFLSGFLKMLSAAKNLTSKNYLLNTRVIFYLLRLLRNFMLAIYQGFLRASHSNDDASALSFFDSRAEILYSRFEEILHIISAHQSTVHFICCDKIRHEIFLLWDFFDWLRLYSHSHQRSKSLSTMLEIIWRKLTMKTGMIFQRNPSYILSHIYSKSDCNDPIEKVRIASECDYSVTDLQKLKSQWDTYQGNLWGSDPESPPAPRRSERISSHFNFSREEKSFCKYGQRLASPQHQSSF